MTVLPVFLIASLLLLTSALLLLSSTRQLKKVVRSRAKIHQSLSDYARESLQAAGIPVNASMVVVAALLTATASVVIVLMFDAWLVPLFLLLLVVLINAFFRFRIARLRAGIRAQMPNFLDQLNRDLAAGQGLEIAFKRAASHIEKPLRPVMNRILNRVNLGQQIDDCIQHEALLLKSFELELLATIISVNLKHGGSAKSALESYINMLRLDERNKRELHAMTGETRVTAWILGLVPVFVLVVMFLTNRSFLDSMLESQGGQTALLMAVGLQVAGAIALYRMLRFK